MSDTENTENEKFESAYDDNKDSSASEPVVDGQSLVTPDHTDVSESDDDEPADADVTHKASAENVESSA